MKSEDVKGVTLFAIYVTVSLAVVVLASGGLIVFSGSGVCPFYGTDDVARWADDYPELRPQVLDALQDGKLTAREALPLAKRHRQLRYAASQKEDWKKATEMMQEWNEGREK